MIDFILLILTFTFGYLSVTEQNLNKKLIYVGISVLIDLTWFCVDLYQHEYFWAVIWILISLLDSRTFKNIQDAINKEE